MVDISTEAVLQRLTEAATLFEAYEQPIGKRHARQIIQTISSLRQAAESETQKGQGDVVPWMLADTIASQADDIYVRLVAYHPYRQSCELSYLQERQALAKRLKALIEKLKQWRQAVSISQEEHEPFSW